MELTADFLSAPSGTCARLFQIGERGGSLLTTHWSKSTLSAEGCGGPALHHGFLNPLFQVAVCLPSYQVGESADAACLGWGGGGGSKGSKPVWRRGGDVFTEG